MHLIVRLIFLVALVSVLVHSQGARGGGGSRRGSRGSRGELVYEAEETIIALSLQVELVPTVVAEVVPVKTVTRRFTASLL